IGREFSYGLLIATAQRTDAEVRCGLGGLVNSGLVFQRGAIPEATFAFKHALVRDAAHGTLLRGARQRLHGRIAEVLEAHSPELIDSQPEVLAQHYAEAGLVEKSAAWWGKAGHRSTARSAMAEAAAQFQKGLDQLALLPDTPERQRQELEFCSDLGAVLRTVKGLAAPEAGHVYARALTSAIDRPLPDDHPEMRDYARAAGFRGLATELATDPAILAHRYALSLDIDTLVLGVKNRQE